MTAEMLEAARTRFIAEYPILKAAAEGSGPELTGIFRRNGIPCLVSSRAKDIASFVKKIQLKADYASDPWGRTTDKVGLRVVVDFLDDIPKVLEAISADDRYEIVGTVEDKRSQLRSSELGYLETRAQILLKEHYLSDGTEIEAELQVRSRAEDLWALMSHKLFYKPVMKGVLDQADERRFFRLIALVELFDEEVRNTMRKVGSDPRLREAKIYQIVEAQYLRFVAKEGDVQLSFEVINELCDALRLDWDSMDGYADRLSSFVEQNTGKLESLFADYGYNSDWAGRWNYWLFTQPECIALLERLDADAAGVRDAFRNSHLSAAIRPLSEAWGVPFDDPT